jgi:ubiquinone/menaquinone biosynthesis C-methylase UbiE
MLNISKNSTFSTFTNNKISSSISLEPVYEVMEWTKWYAPPIEKTIDILIARHLVNIYFKSGIVIDIACGAGRFGNSIFKDLSLTHKLIVDGLDLELEKESSLCNFLNYKWSANAFKTDYNNTGIKSDAYDFIFCNNSFFNSADIRTTLKEMARICKKNGMIICNFPTPLFAKGLDNLASILPSLNMEEFNSGISSRRFPYYINPTDIKNILLETNWELEIAIEYMSDNYSDTYYKLYLPYSLYWKYDTEQLDKPKGYLPFKEKTHMGIKNYILHNIENELLCAINNKINGPKVYIAARNCK